MTIHLGMVAPGSTIYVPFDTFAGATGASITMTGLAVGDILIYKNGGTTQRGSTTGFTLLDTDGIDFDAITGIHGLSIDLSSNSTADFYNAGAFYWIVISAITVDAQTVSFVLATFTIGYTNAVLNTTIATLASQTSFTLTAGPAEDDALNGCTVVIHDIASAVQLGKAVVLDYTGSTKTVTLVAGVTFTAAAGDNISVFVPALQPTTWGRTFDISATGEGGLDWANIGSPTTAQNLSATNIDVDQVVASVSGAVGSVTGAVGSVTGAVGSVTGNVGGNVVGSVASVAAGGITASSIATDAIDADALADGAITAATFAAGAITATVIATGAIDADAIADNAIDAGAIAADAITAAKIADGAIDAATFAAGAINAAAIATDAITAAKIAADAIGASELAADAVTEIQSGLATAAALTVIDDFLDTEIAAIITTLGTPAGVSISADIAAIEVQTDDIGAAGAGLTAIPWNAAWDAEVQSEVQDAIEANNLDHLAGTATGIPAIPAGTYIDQMMDDGTAVYDRTTDSLQAIADSGGGGPTAGQIADAVWDETLADHLGAGSTGAGLNAAGSAGDPWSTALPGAYGAGTGGFIVGTNLNATVSSRATPAQVNTEVDTALADYDAPTSAELVSEINSVQADIAALNNLSAAQVWDLTNGIETGLTPRQAMRLIAAATAGKLSGAATVTVTIRNSVADDKNRIIATVDADGNRSALVYDLT